MKIPNQRRRQNNREDQEIINLKMSAIRIIFIIDSFSYVKLI